MPKSWTFQWLIRCIAVAAIALAISPPSHAATGDSRFFPFVIPWNDARAGTPNDVSFLNHPIEPVVARDGHFYGARSGRRIRFLGVNFAAGAAFPDHATARLVAAHLAKYGINLVRLHHMDNTWGNPRQTIWDMTYPDHRHIDKGQLDRLDYLVAQLEAHGIYVDVNLHVSRQFTQADGFPAAVEQIPFGYDKRVDNFDATMIVRQKEYALALLTHVNPYTGKSFATDPGVAMIEVNNENSLVGDPWAPAGAGLDTLPDPYRAELIGLWNAWLKGRYTNDAALNAAWTKGISAGPDLTGPATRWELELHDQQSLGMLSPSQPAGSQTAPDVRVTCNQVDGTDWHVQLKINGLTFRNGQTYSVTFRARADYGRTIGVYTNLDQPDWHNTGLLSTAALDSPWQTYRYVFTAKDVMPGHCRLAFELGAVAGTVWIAGLTVSTGLPSLPLLSKERAGVRFGGLLPPGESLAAGTIGIPASDYSVAVQQDDWLDFLADTERAYADQMRAYLKHDLGVHANVVDSQLGFGGLSSIGREQSMDYADNHAYWHHPSFPHKQWDPVDWAIGNTSMVDDLASGGGGTLLSLSEYRVAGKPYTVSEYNEPAPSDFQSETLPVIASFAAAQDWDAVMLFDYGDYGPGTMEDRINGYFGIGSNPSKMAFMPAAAMLFRAGAIDLLPGQTTVALLSGDRSSRKLQDLWPTAPDIFHHRVAVVPTGLAKGASRQAHASDTSDLSDTQRPTLTVLRNGDHGIYIAQGAAGQALAGFVGGRSLTLGSATYTFARSGNGFAVVTLTAVDMRPLSASRHLLLTLAGKVENQDMVWNSTRTSVGADWGHGPVQAEAVPVTVTLHVDGPRTVYALDATGTPTQSIPAAYIHGTLTFQAGDADTMWYAIVGCAP